MKLSNITVIPLLASMAEGFSMLSPRFSLNFDKYLRDMDELFERDWPSSMMEKQLKELEGTMGNDRAMTFYRASPKYDVTHNHEKFEVKLDLPGYKPDEIDVGIRGGGRMLSITGQHKEENEGSSMSSRFQQNFSLDPTIVLDELKADMVGTTLVVSAPRKAELLIESRKIPVNAIAASDATVPITKHDEQKETLPKNDETSLKP